MVQALAHSGGQSEGKKPRRVGPLVVLACCTIAGVLAGTWWPQCSLWLCVAIPPLIVMVVMAAIHRPRGVRVWGCIAWIALMAAWSVLDQQYLPADHITRYIGRERQLATVSGIVEEPGHQTSPPSGSLAQFSRRSPSTLAAVHLTAVEVHGRNQPASGTLLLKIPQVETRLAAGLPIRTTGWLEAIDGPSNPGEMDYRQILGKQGINGQLILDNCDNWRPLDPPEARQLAGNVLARSRTVVQALRQKISGHASQSLRLGLTPPDALATNRPATRPTLDPSPASVDIDAAVDSDAASPSAPATEIRALERDRARIQKQERRADFLDALLLGRRSEDLGEISDSFRRSGLIHLLSISGAHIGILLGVVWGIARLLTGRPRRAALALLTVLLIYLTALPMQLPIVRCGIMAGMLALGYLLNRQMRTIDLVALAAIVVLLWRPADLLTPGFQLSFGVTAGLLLFTKSLRDRFLPTPLIKPPTWTWRQTAARWAAGLLAADLVGFAVSLPIVAYHFSWVSPVSLLLSVLALPLVTLTLTLGYLKIAVGLILPAAGVWLAHPLAWSSDGMTGLVAWMSNLPLGSFQLHHSPSTIWALTALALTILWLANGFRGQRAVATGVLIVWALWLFAGNRVAAVPPPRPDSVPAPLLRLDMLAVGNGSCYLVRVGPDHFWHGPVQTLMFDCGSQPFPDVGSHTVVPALRQLGVDRINTLVISHPDLDHLCGTLDVAEHLPIDRLLVNPQFLSYVSSRPESPAALLLTGLRQSGTKVETVSRGWNERWQVDGTAAPDPSNPKAVMAEVLWPPATFTPVHPNDTNDTSTVLALRAAGRRILLNGDIQGEAMAGLFDPHADLHADLVDLPHHGSFVDQPPRFRHESVKWLAAVNPSLVLQSAGPSHLEPWNDRWAEVLKTRKIDRLVTAQRGLVEIAIYADGSMARWSFKKVDGQ